MILGRSLRVSSVITWRGRPEFLEEVICAACASKPIKGFDCDATMIVEAMDSREAAHAAATIAMRQDGEAWRGCWRCQRVLGDEYTFTIVGVRYDGTGEELTYSDNVRDAFDAGALAMETHGKKYRAIQIQSNLGDVEI